MGAPLQGLQATDDSTAEALLSSLKTIAAAERRKHATVFNYWLSIRGNRQFPPIRDLDPLEISDAGPYSVLLEMIGGGEDADVRHLGQAIKCGVEVDKVGEAPNPSLLSCIAGKLPIVAASSQAFAFEDEFATDEGTTRCWVTLLPFSATGTWIDYVYGFVSLEPPPNVDGLADAEPSIVEEEVEAEEPPVVEEEAEADEPAVAEAEPVDELPEIEEPVAQADEDDDIPEFLKSGPQPTSVSGKPGFSAKLFESLASVGGFYGRVVEVESNSPEPALAGEEPEEIEEPEQIDAPEEIDAPEPRSSEPAAEDEFEEAEVVPDEPDAEEDFVEADIVPEEPIAEEQPEPTNTAEGPLQNKLVEVRAKADEARTAKLRANAALYEGLGAAYDFALDAEENAEEYLKLVEAQGLKIQLRSPMKPVVKLAFDGMCDEHTIAQLEAVLAWALKNDLPRGSLAERLEAEGGIGPIINGHAKAA